MKKFDVLLMDFPWNFETYAPTGQIKTPAAHYKTMSIEEGKKLPIANLTNKNAALFFWVVDWMEPKICQELANAWGFRYATRAWVWIKQNKNGLGFFQGTGFYTTANPEDCWLFVRGSMPVSDRGVSSIIYSPVREHSRKPDEQYYKIDKLYPELSYLELFGRRRWPGWEVWGNEVDSTININDYY